MGIEEAGEPLLVEWGLHPRCVSFDCGPQLACLRHLSPGRQAARLEQPADQRLEPLGSGKRDAGLPVLHRAQAHAGPRREVALGQASPTAMAQEQATKGLRCVRRVHDPPVSTLAQSSSEASGPVVGQKSLEAA